MPQGKLIEHSEAVRQLSICNACRYCEGYCGAFQALTRYREFDAPTVSHLANLCHNCRGCYYACQYTEPHEFSLNIPALLANIRAQNWEQHIHLMFIVLFSSVLGVAWWSSDPFYASLSHNAMVLVFVPLFVLPLISQALGLRRYWQSIGGTSLAFNDVLEACRSAATLRQLDGGQGQGCNYETQDRYTSRRRWAHQATMYGFMLCFASTSTATLYHYLLDASAPYPLFSVPKLLGVVGGVLLSIGTVMLAVLKWKASTALGSQARLISEYVFIVLLFLVSSTGLLLYWSSGSSWASTWLIIHLAVVATFFVSIPFSKMTHGFFRMAALCREAQLKRLG